VRHGGVVYPDEERGARVTDDKFGRSSGLTVVASCFMTIVFDGYDLIVYGSIVSSW
jgi:hypothetical protein